MKHSIKKQIAISYISVLAGTILLCLLFNMVFLKAYYVHNRQDAIMAAYEQINFAADNNELKSEAFIATMRHICEKYNISVIVMNDDQQIIASLQSDSKTLQEQLIYNFLYDMNTAEVIEETPDYVLQHMTDRSIKMEYIEMWGVLDNGDRFLIRTALESIEDSAKIANKFLLCVGTLTAIAGVIIIVIITNRITKPILALTDISEKMTNLDFEAKYYCKGQTEIDLLGEHINQMSCKLENTISELKTANNELINDIEKKEKIDEMRKEFLSNVSHELKTPIALIQGYAEGLKEGVSGEDEESKEFYCDVIMDEANKMNLMVKNLLSLNELEFGTDVIQMERFDVTELIRNILQSMDVLLKQDSITLDIELTEPIYVWADEYKIEEVMRNYLSNAINHAAGEVKQIKICMIKENANVRVCVFNSGFPIPEENLPYIWDKFYKVDKARTREYGGSGVGLSIVKAIMESLNQNYGVVNQEDGVMFWFELSME